MQKLRSFAAVTKPIRRGWQGEERKSFGNRSPIEAQRRRNVPIYDDDWAWLQQWAEPVEAMSAGLAIREIVHAYVTKAKLKR